jgi:hypothetical protein
MKTIIIKTQKEFDELPDSFEEFTRIEIRSSEAITIKNNKLNSVVTAYNSSKVTAYNSSTVTACNSSIVRAYDSSKVTAYDSSKVYACNSSIVRAYDSSTVTACNSSIVRAYDSSTVTAYDSSIVYACNSSKVTAYECSVVRAYSNSSVFDLYDNVTLYNHIDTVLNILSCELSVNIVDKIITPNHEQWLSRGIIFADGIKQRIKSQKTIGEITIFETEENSFVVKRGDKFAHGKTLEEAKNDLRYKLSDRDTVKYKSWSLQDIKPTDELIESYMGITGACSYGTKMFCEKLELENSYTIAEIIVMTKGSYGNETYRSFEWRDE